MKRNGLRSSVTLAGALALAAAANAQMAVDTGFTYQGRLTDAGSTPTGQYDMLITLWDNATGPAGGTQRGSMPLENVQVNAGLFTARLTFLNQFTTQKRWLQIAVRPGASTGAYTTLLPRQEVTSAPWANYALGPWETVTGMPYPQNGFYLRSGDNSYFGMDSDFGDLHVNGGNDGAFGITSDGPASGSFNISTGGIARFTINNGTGSVGINATPVPSAKLYVIGDPINAAISAETTTGNAMYAYASTTGTAVRAEATSGTGIFASALSSNGKGVHGVGPTGVLGAGTGNGTGVSGTASTGRGVQGTSVSGRGIEGVSGTGIGVTGDCTSAGTYGFLGDPGAGVVGNGGSTRDGVVGLSAAAYGVKAQSGGSGIGGAGILATNNSINGIALVTSTNSGDANTVLINTGAGDLIRCFSGGGGGNQVFTVTNCGTAIAKVIQIQGGCDVAEPFHVGKSADQPAIEPGMVVAIDPDNPGSLMLTDRPYDTRVAGIISGANGLAPGLTLSSDDHAIVRGEHPVAMTGRVWCRVDADLGAIKPGDMLTTSAIPGTAMKAGDAAQSHGAVIGKAMTGLENGRGLVLVLVNLQ